MANPDQAANRIRPPSVNDVPEEAKWLAQDSDGLWWCFNYRPIYVDNGANSYWDSDDTQSDSWEDELWVTFPAIDPETTLVQVRP